MANIPLEDIFADVDMKPSGDGVGAAIWSRARLPVELSLLWLDGAGGGTGGGRGPRPSDGIAG